MEGGHDVKGEPLVDAPGKKVSAVTGIHIRCDKDEVDTLRKLL